jgi:hypothetical protein
MKRAPHIQLECDSKRVRIYTGWRVGAWGQSGGYDHTRVVTHAVHTSMSRRGTYDCDREVEGLQDTHTHSQI